MYMKKTEKGTSKFTKMEKLSIIQWIFRSNLNHLFRQPGGQFLVNRQQIKILDAKDCFAVKNLYLCRIFCGGNYVHTRKRKLDKLYWIYRPNCTTDSGAKWTISNERYDLV